MGNLYEKEFDEKLGEAESLMYARLQWTDEDVVKLCGAIATGKLVKLEKLVLQPQPDWRRRRCARGGGGLAEVVGKLPQLKKLILHSNPNISQQAKDALKAALPSCA